MISGAGRALSLAAVLALSRQGAPLRIATGPETLVSAGEDFAHVETMLAVDPLDPRRVLASSIILPGGGRDGKTWRVRAYRSADGGASWKPSALPDEASSDPVVAFTPRGTALFAFLNPPKRLSVMRSTDAGDTWRQRVDLPFTDHAMIGVDWTEGPSRGRVYLAGRLGEERQDPIVLFRSSDDGRSFASAVVVGHPIAGSVLDVIVLPESTIVIPFSVRSQDGSVDRIFCARSLDGGRTFSEPFAVAERPVETEGRYGDFAAPAFAADPRTRAQRLFVVYTLKADAPHARLVLRRSDDGGRTWSQPRGVAPGAPPAATQSVASVAVNPAGVVGVSWLERTIGAAPTDDPECGRLVCFDDTFDVFFTASADGNAFAAPVRVTSRSSTPRPKHAGRFLPGFDYMKNAASPDGTFHLLWPDARSGTFQLYTSAVRVR
jgi:photosystem II stability/assembly factor-like uncharacterized protein